jgi:outer membrane receptor protein involved in Fe transport
MNRLLARALLGAASSIVLSALAVAQPVTTAPATTEAAPAAGDAVERITVTAQKRLQRNHDVPINITAYTGSFLEDQGITSFGALSGLTPGLIVQEQSPNNPGFVIRGLTSDSGESNIEPRVSVFQDGVSISRSRGSIVELFDMQRIEVLKGPQSTLFGRSALIGAINLIQNKPDDENYATLTLGGGNEGQMRGVAVVNQVIVPDEVFARVAATLRRTDGVVDNILPAGVVGPDSLNSADLMAARAGLRFQGSRSTFDLIVNYQKDQPTGTGFKSGTISAFNGDTNPFTHASLNTFGGFENGANLSVDREVYGATLLGSIQISDTVSVSTITSGRKFSSLEVFDADGSAFDLLVAAEDASGSEYAQEVRLNYESDRIHAFAGVNVAFEKGRQRAPLATDERQFAAWERGVGAFAPTIAAGDPAALAPFLGLFPFKSFHVEEFTNGNDTTAADLFADIAYDVTDDFTLTAGIRFSTESKKTTYAAEALNGPSALALFLSGGLVQTLAVANTGGTEFSRSDDFEGLTWRFVADYKYSEDTNLYASYARGRRPEVIDVADVNAVGTFAGFAVLPEETVDSYEAGIKSILADGNLSLEGSVYYYTYSNYQTTQNNAVTFFPEFVNAGGATSYGAEFQARARMADWLEGFATYAYNHGRFDDNSVFAGNQFRLSPDHAASLGLDFHTMLGNDLKMFFRPTWTWKSKVFFEEGNDPLLAQTDYGQISLRSGLTFGDGRFTGTVFANNLLDEEFIIDAGNTGGTIGSPTFIRGNPRFIGLELSGRL